MTTLTPMPPFLVLRDGISFWVERRPAEEWTATAQALQEGCFTESHAYDNNGNLWPIVEAHAARPPSLAERLLPWLRIPVTVTFGVPCAPTVYDVAERVVKTLTFEGHEYSAAAEQEVHDKARHASTAAELIEAMAKFSGK